MHINDFSPDILRTILTFASCQTAFDQANEDDEYVQALAMQQAMEAELNSSEHKQFIRDFRSPDEPVHFEDCLPVWSVTSSLGHFFAFCTAASKFCPLVCTTWFNAWQFHSKTNAVTHTIRQLVKQNYIRNNAPDLVYTVLFFVNNNAHDNFDAEEKDMLAELIRCDAIRHTAIDWKIWDCMYITVPKHPHTRDVPTSWSLLHYAVYTRKVSLVALLLDAGIPINIQDNAGVTPLHIATSKGTHHILWLTSRNNPDQLKGYNGILDEQLETVRLLLEHDADPTMQDNLGQTPMDYSDEPEIHALLQNYTPTHKKRTLTHYPT